MGERMWNGQFMIPDNFPHYQIDILASNSKRFFSKPTGNPKKPISETILLWHQYGQIFSHFRNWFFKISGGFKKKTFLCLMLKHQCDNVISCLELWFGHFTSSHPPRFRYTSVLFYLIKWQKCCFRGPIQMLFSVPGGCLMARMAQILSEIHLRT